jgi:glucose-6-phosphate 1-epimerase
MLMTSGDYSLQVDAQGGTILSWQCRNNFILGPARMELINGALKQRGFSHWCAPNFGKSTGSTVWGALSQHGFLRNAILVGKAERLEGEFSSDEHPGVSCRIAVHSAVADSVLEIGLLIRNTSAGSALPILPGFHPYFAVPDNGIDVRMGGDRVPVDLGRDAVATRILRRADPIEISLNGIGTVTMTPSANCEYVVVWSDKPSAYLCVEPVFDGTPGTFGTSEHSRVLLPGESAESKVSMDFRPAR